MVTKPRTVHFQLVEDDPKAPGSAKDRRYYAACAPYLTVSAYHGRRLSPHPVLVSCPKCKALIEKARAEIRAERRGRPS